MGKNATYEVIRQDERPDLYEALAELVNAHRDELERSSSSSGGTTGKAIKTGAWFLGKRSSRVGKTG